MLVDRAQCDKGARGHTLSRGRRIGKHRKLVSAGDGIRHLPTRAIDRVQVALLTGAAGEGDVHNLCLPAGHVLVDVLDCSQVGAREHGLLKHQSSRLIRSRLQQIRHGPHGAPQRHDDSLPKRVDWRVCDLRKMLLEVLRHNARGVRKARERRVVAHRPQRLLARLQHRLQEHGHVLHRVAVLGQARVRNKVPPRRIKKWAVRLGCFFGNIGEFNGLGVDPFAVWVLGRDPLLELSVADNRPFLRVNEEHAARLEAAFGLDESVGNGQHTDLTRRNHAVVRRHIVPAGPQTVPVEHSANITAVGKREIRRSVPGLHQERRVLIQRPLARVHHGVVFPRLRDQHHHSLRERLVPRHKHKLKHVVQHHRVGPAVLDDRIHAPQLGLVVSRAAHHALACAHPVAIATHSVDFSVVANVPQRLRAVPAGECIGRKAAVHKRKMRRKRRAAEVGKVVVELLRCELALVGDGACRQRAHKEPRLFGYRIRRALAEHICTPSHLILADGRSAARRRNKHLRNEWLFRLCRRPNHAVVRRNLPPPEHIKPTLARNPPKHLLRLLAHILVWIQKDEAGGISARGGQLHAKFLPRNLCIVLVRDARHHTCTVTSVCFAATGTAMRHVPQDNIRIFHNLARRSSLDIDNKADAAAVFLQRSIVEASLGSTRR
eukprot:Opistho-2@20012